MANMNTTVASLVSALSGQPPMMEVFADAEGIPMYLTELRVDDSGNVPILILQCNSAPKAEPEDNRSYDEKVDEQRQKAMHMGSETDRASKMPPMVD